MHVRACTHLKWEQMPLVHECVWEHGWKEERGGERVAKQGQSFSCAVELHGMQPDWRVLRTSVNVKEPFQSKREEKKPTQKQILWEQE